MSDIVQVWAVFESDIREKSFQFYIKNVVDQVIFLYSLKLIFLRIKKIK